MLSYTAVCIEFNSFVAMLFFLFFIFKAIAKPIYLLYY